MSNINPNENSDLLLTLLNSFRTKILALKNMCEGTSDFNSSEANKILNDGIYDLIEIKHLNSKVQLNYENKKEEYEKNKDNIGKDYLNLKKYEYHLDLIKNDIFSNKQLPNFPQSERVKREDNINDNDNNIKLDEVFNNLLLGRKRLNDKLIDLKEEKKKSEKELKMKQNNMKEIPKYLELLEKEANKTKKIFNDCKL